MSGEGFIDDPVPTFTAYVRETGEPITVDLRTYDDLSMSKVWPLPVANNATEKQL